MFEEKAKGQPQKPLGNPIDRILIVAIIVVLVAVIGMFGSALMARFINNNLYGASVPLQLGEVLVSETFDHPDAWEYYEDEYGSFLRVEDGHYRMTVPDWGFIWGLNETGHNNVLIEVTTTQLSYERNNAYGVMCRADRNNNGDGYYFLISGDGFYSIRYAIENMETIEPIIDFTYSDVIQQGQATNHIRVACVDDYLALWVNDSLLAETHDSRIASGLSGFSVAVTTDYPSDATDVIFDNATITAVTIAQ